TGDTLVIDTSAFADAVSGGLNVGGFYYNSNSTAFATVSGFEALDFKGNANGTIGGNGITASAGNDTLIGLAGNDSFAGGPGDNVIDGGAGTDFASLDFSNRGSGLDFVNGGVDGVTYTPLVGGNVAGSVANIEILNVSGTNSNDRIGAVFKHATYGNVFAGNGGTGDTLVVDTSTLPDPVSGGLNVGGFYYN